MKTQKNIESKPWMPAVILAGHIVLFLSLPAAPLLDLPNHLVRSWAIGEQLAGRPSPFIFEFMFMPYVLGDLLLASALSFFSWHTVETLWMVACYISMPIGVWFYCRSLRLEAGIADTALVFSAYASANWFFLSGFANFCLSIGLVFSAAAAWECLSKAAGVRKMLLYVVCLVLVLLCYLLHLAAFVFAGAIVAGSTLSRVLGRRQTILSAFGSGAIFVAVLVLHLCIQQDAPDISSPWQHRGLLQKPLAIGSMYVRYNARVDAVLLLAIFGGLLVLALWPSRQERQLNLSGLREVLMILATLTLVYLVLPVKADPAYGVDSRALPYMSIAGLLALLLLVQSHGAARLKRARKLVFGVSLVSLVYLVPFMRAHANFVSELDDAWQQIPIGQSVLPVATVPDIGRVQPALHRAELYTIERGGFVPYVFSFDTAGGQIRYFRYEQTYPYAPDIKWYLRREEIRWSEVALIYSYLFITKPYQEERLSELNFDLVYENDAAAVLKLSASQEAVAPPQLLPAPAVQPKQ